MGTTQSEQFQSVKDFRVRLGRLICETLLPPARFTRNESKFAGADQTGPMQRNAEAKIDALLKEKQRIAPARARLGATTGALSLRDLFKEVNALADGCVTTSCEAMERASELGANYYRSSTESDECGTLEAYSRGELCSAAYLSWVRIARSLSLAGQDCLRSYLSAEHVFIREFYESDLFWAAASPARASKKALQEEITKLTSYLESPAARPERTIFKQFRLIQLQDEMNAPIEAITSPSNKKIVADAARRERNAALNRLTMALPPPVVKALKRRPDGARTGFDGHGWYDWQQPTGFDLRPWPFPRKLNGCEDTAKLLDESARWKAFGVGLHALPIDGLGSDASEDDWATATEAFAVVTDAALTLVWLAHVVEACVSAQQTQSCSYCYRPVDTGTQQRKRCAIHQTRSSNRTEAARWAVVAEDFHARLSVLKSTLAAQPAYLDPGPRLTAYWRTMMASVYGRSPESTDTAWHFHSPYRACLVLSRGLRNLLRELEPMAGPVVLRELRKLASVLIKTAISSVRAREQDSAQVAVHALSPPVFFHKWLQQSGCLPLQDSTAPAPVLWIPMEQVVQDLLRYRAWMETGGANTPHVNSKKSAFCVADAADLRKQGHSYAAIGLHFGVSKQYVGKMLQQYKATVNPS